ncbi:hypothetical protein CLAFUW4_10242 [Fulvia fulva]|nr:hypothetical protein CLAFUR4_10246 [Fulvia fulva]KAK4617072.1 hypothetical protein CLAFUR0_10244 [Fulvia fulva]WPV18856.1 hypothetical protein CLAFUW4_10242 [Fulvia fulva]WPV34197.1 hypothetical protein CLAFUW7_10242 [Fulvia fulva]
MALRTTPEKVTQERDIDHVKGLLCETALELAVLGEVDSARDLLSLLASATGEPVSLFQAGLSFASRATGQWPVGTSEEAKSQDALSKLRQRCKRDSSHGFPIGGNVYDESGLKACLEAKDVYGADSTTGSSAMGKGVRLVQALDISLKLHCSGGPLDPGSQVRRSARIASLSDSAADQSPETVSTTSARPGGVAVADLDAQSAEVVGMIAVRWRAYQQIRYLAEAESLWPYWLAGLLADALSLDRDDLTAKGQALVETFKSRLDHGFVPSILAGKSMKELLDLAAKSSFDRMTEDGHPESSRMFFKAGASEEEIEALEGRLQTVLPDDYREFLQITNGFGVGESGIYNGYFPSPALHATVDVKWDEEEYLQLPVELLQLPRELEQLATSHWKQRSTRPNGYLDWEGALPIFDRVLELGTLDIYNIWLVHPMLVEQCRNAYHEMYRNANKKQRKRILLAMESFAGSKGAFEQLHWCCVTWAAGGSACMTAYASFRDYIEAMTLRSMQRRAE